MKMQQQFLWNLFSIFPIFLITTGTLVAQQFDPVVVNGFGLSTAIQPPAIDLVDLDGDGDLDLMAGNGSFFEDADIAYYENVGTPENPQFAAPQTNPFGLTELESNSTVAFVDLDDDGDYDMMVGLKISDLEYYENTGDANNPQFGSPVQNPFGIQSLFPNGNLDPVFVDIDADGDQDLFVGLASGNLAYFENTGTAAAPQFGSSVECPFSLGCYGFFVSPAFADIDADGDMDLFIGNSNSDIDYYENIGTTSSPSFDEIVNDPFGLPEDIPGDQYPAFGDLDADGDLDLLIGAGADFWYFENTTMVSAAVDANIPQLRVYPNPAVGQVEVEGADAIVRLEIFDLNGRLLIEENSPDNGIRVDDLSAGMYLLRATDAQGRVGQKMVVVTRN